MSINLEQIDLLRARANVGYQEAKDALEKCNNNVVEALAYLERENKIKPEKVFKTNAGNACGKAKGLLDKLNRIRFVVKKEDNVIVNIPLTAAIIVTVVVPPLVAIILLLAIITKHRIRFEKQNGEDLCINKVVDKVSNTVTATADKISEEFAKI